MMGGRRPASGAGSYFNASSNPRVAATGQILDPILKLLIQDIMAVPSHCILYSYHFKVGDREEIKLSS